MSPQRSVARFHPMPTVQLKSLIQTIVNFVLADMRVGGDSDVQSFDCAVPPCEPQLLVSAGSV